MTAPLGSEHFHLDELAPGVYAAIASETGAGFSNAGVVDLGDRTLAFDAFENPAAAEDLLAACSRITGRAPSVVIVSHWHPDHWGGLQVFAGCSIVSTRAARQAMIPVVEDLSVAKDSPSEIEAELLQDEARLAAETDPDRRRVLRASVARTRHFLAGLATLVPTLPNETFEGPITFHGTRRCAELIPAGKGHTDGDALLLLRGDRVAFVGDIGFFSTQPFMPYGYPGEWLAHLDEMADWDVDVFVPGHGPVGGKDDVALEARYIRELESLVRRVVEAGGGVDEALAQVLPPPFDAWQALGQRFEANVRASFARQSGLDG